MTESIFNSELVTLVAVSILDEIIARDGTGECPLPVDVRTFQALQEVCDANEYIVAAVEDFGIAVDNHAFWNEVTAKIDSLWAARETIR